MRLLCTSACFALFVAVWSAPAAFADGHMEGPAPKDTTSPDALPPQTEFFDELDANADGAVSSDEFRGSAEAFRLLDLDKDGKITTTELGLPADYRPDPKAKAKRDAIRAREERGDRGTQGARDRMATFLKRMDTNGNSKIEREEWKGRPEAFDRIDQNGDGVLDANDRMKGRGDGAKQRGRSKQANPKQIERAFQRMDKNGDGKVSADEMPRPERMKQADTDGDGTVSLEEFTAAAKRLMGGARGAGRRGLKAAQLRRFDKDGDGEVTRDEFPGNDRIFKRYDVNGDGVLNSEDIASDKQGRPGKQDAPAPKGPVTESASLIKTYDKDGDGKLNRAEFTGSNDEWKKLDRDGDGWVTPFEAGEASK